MPHASCLALLLTFALQNLANAQVLVEEYVAAGRLENRENGVGDEKTPLRSERAKHSRETFSLEFPLKRRKADIL
jgi:hypothetical protein